MEKLNSVYSNGTLNTVIEQQVFNLLSKKISSVPKRPIEANDLRKAVWLASVLAESDNEIHLKKVQDFAILLFLNNQDDYELLKIVYILFSRIGNLTATRFLKNLMARDAENHGSNFQENILLTQELFSKRIENSVIVNDKQYLLTDFQKELFENLRNEKYISISAPTSSGKSFILKKYIESVLNEARNYCVFYIVPSRALINQVSEDLRTELPNISVRNAFIETEEIDQGKIIYVITPERAVKIINSEIGIKLPDLIFIDEIQNVENEDGRGNLFEYVYEELSRVSENTKIITAGPYISNSAKVYKELFDKDSTVVNTDLSPVFQLRTIIKLNENSLSLTLFVNNKVFYMLEDVLQIDGIEKAFNANIGEGLAQIINSLTDAKESNLVYSSRGDYAEIWALKYAESVNISESLDDDLLDLIKFVKTEIHSKYYLIRCLEKRVAFHHSSLSEFVRKEIETLFESGVITTLFCTSTLLEGVNLPADNLFVIKPEKNKEELSDFEFGNLIGRAGRLKNSLFGTIYCVSKKNNVEWAEEYYQAKYSKEVQTFSSKALPEIAPSDITDGGNQIDTPKIKNVVTSLRNKALKSDGSLEKFLIKHNIDEAKAASLVKSLGDSINDVTIPYSIVKQNPTIDPILQDQLYKKVLSEIDNWVIHSHSNFNTSYDRPAAESMPYKERSFFWQLDSIIFRLNEIFKFTEELWKKDNFSIPPTVICINAINWLQGKSIGELIANRIKYLSEDERVKPQYKIDATSDIDVNRQIKIVIKINLKVITFSLLKYLKLLIDILGTVLTEGDKERFKLTLALPIQLELGTQEPIVISLISNGVPRTIAIKLFEIFKRTEDYKNETKIFAWMKKQTYIVGLEPIYNKFLSKNNFTIKNSSI
ncbi:MAG TPA: DEAD/DEAH box helicase [Flavipsychrobacter sp.]|nr:DEAD/DEAH box helicase [Flavipsychrobacter sp.]